MMRIKNYKRNFYPVDIKEYNLLTTKCDIGLGLQWIDSLPDNVLLSETETIFILDLSSNVVSQEDNDEYNKTNQKNKIYMEVRETFIFESFFSKFI
jgi:hypothetical protein